MILQKDGIAQTMTLRGKLKIDAAPGVLAAALAGLGIANVTTLMSEQELREGKLVRLMSDYELEPLQAFAVFPSGPKPSTKVQMLVSHLIAALAT